MKTFSISSSASAFIRETATYRTLTFQSQVNRTSGKIAPKLISVETIRFATDEILYHAKRSYFLALLSRMELRARTAFLWREERRRVAFYADLHRRTLSFPLWGWSVKRAWAREFARNVAENASSRVLSRDCKLHLRLWGERREESGDARVNGRDYRGFLEAFGVAAAAAAAAATLLGYTPDILPDNGRSGNHWSSPLLA